MQNINNLSQVSRMRAGLGVSKNTGWPVARNGEIDHGSDEITNDGTAGGVFSMENFDRNNGLVSGGVTIEEEDIVFDGLNGTFINLGDISNETAISITSKITPRDVSSNRTILSKVSGGSATNIELLIRLISGRIRFEMSDGSLHQVIQSDTILNINEEYTFCVSWDGTTNAGGLRLYINGSLDKEATSIISSRINLSNVLYLGDYKRFNSQTYNQRYNGKISYIRFYNKGLSAVEAFEEHNSLIYSTITDGSLVAQYTGKDFSKTLLTILDRSGNNNNGDVTGLVSIEEGNLLFDGSTGYVDSGVGLNTSSFRVKAVINTTQSVGTGVIIDDRTSPTDGFVCFFGSATSYKIRCTLGIGSITSLNSINQINDGLDHEIIVDFDGTTFRLYVDGVLNDSDTAIAGTTSNSMRIGAIGSFTTAGLYLNGSLKYIKVYDDYEGTIEKISYDGLLPYVPTNIYDTNMVVEGLSSSSPYSIEFDGTNDYLSTGVLSIDNSTPGQSIAFGISVNSFASDGGFFGYTDGSSQRFLCKTLTSGKLFVELPATTGSRRYTSTTTLSIGVYYHIVVVLSEDFNFSGSATNDDIKIYINGVEDLLTYVGVGGSPTIYNTMNFGRIGPSGQYTEGVIQEIRLYNRVLKSREIQALANQ